MIVTNQTSSDIYFGPLHLGAGIGTTLTVDDTSATSLYLTNDSVADALNNAYQAHNITVSGQAEPFPRPTGDPKLLHGTGDPNGLVFAPQGSVYLRRDGVQSNGGVLYVKITGVTDSTHWLDMATASGASAVLPAGAITSYGGAVAPSGWLICDGSAISRTLYSVLFTAIGTAYGGGDGVATFNCRICAAGSASAMRRRAVTPTSRCWGPTTGRRWRRGGRGTSTRSSSRP